MVRFRYAAILALSTFASSIASAQTAQVAESQKLSTYINPICKTDLTDFRDKGYMISENSIQYKGRCVDTSKFRPLEIVDRTKDTIVVANFFHQDRYWKATIPLKPAAWKNAFMQIIRFPVVDGVIAAHGQLRFKLADDYNIKLESQSGEAATAVTDSFIWSVEAAFPKGVGYNFAEGAFDNYPIVARVGSAIQRMRESTNPIEQYFINFDKDPTINLEFISKLVASSLQRSADLDMRLFYNTVRPNCISEAFDLIDLVRGVKNVRPFYTVLWIDPVAGPALRALADRGILGARYKDLQQEYSPTIGVVTPPPLAPNKGPIRSLVNKPFAMVTLMPKSGQSARVTDIIQKEVDKTLTQAIPRLSSAAIVPALVSAGSAGALGGVLAYVQSEIGAMVDRINPELPEKESVTVISYLTPWDSSAKRASLVDYNIKADLPFNYVRETEVSSERITALLRKAQANMLELQAKEFARFPIARDLAKPTELAKNPKPIFMIGLVVRLKLQRDRSESTVQAVLSMVPQDLKFATAATLNLDRIHIPMPLKTEVAKYGMAKVPKSTMIITHVQTQHNDITPSIQVDFGQLQPIQTVQTEKDFGIAKVPARPPAILGCGENFGLIPEMQGVFYPNAFGIKPTEWDIGKLGQLGTMIKSNAGDALENYLEGKPVKLGIYSLKFVKALEHCHKLPDGSKEKIKFCSAKAKNQSGYMMWDMDIGVRTLNQNCLRIQRVNDQVVNEGNMTVDAMILDAIKKGEKLATDTVMGAAGPNAALLKSTIETAKKLQAPKK